LEGQLKVEVMVGLYRLEDLLVVVAKEVGGVEAMVVHDQSVGLLVALVDLVVGLKLQEGLHSVEEVWLRPEDLAFVLLCFLLRVNLDPASLALVVWIDLLVQLVHRLDAVQGLPESAVLVRWQRVGWRVEKHQFVRPLL